MKHLYHIIFLLFILSPATAQTIRYVKANGTGDGTSWDKASADIKAVINMSSRGDQIWIAEGLYANNGLLFIDKGIALYGGFIGNETSIGARKLSSPSSTTIAAGGDYGGGVFQTTGYRPILIDGFYITGGRSSNGGGLSNYADSCRVTNCYFVENVATDRGGAVWNYAGLTLLNCIFKANRSVNIEGGAIFTTSRLRVINCSFVDNSAPRGGAISNAADAYVTNSIFWHNGGRTTFLSIRNYGLTLNLIASYNLLELGVDYTNQNSTYYESSTDVRTSVSPFADNQLRILPTSDAVDAGDPASTTLTSGTQDIAGQNRFYQDGRIDIGAYELQVPYVTSVLYTLKSGSWDDATIWSTGRVPTSTDVVQIRHIVTVADGYSAYCSRIKYTANGRVDVKQNGILKL